MKEKEDGFYFTLAENGKEVLFKDRGSKFFGTAFPLKSELEIKEVLELLRSADQKAGHFCYAWRLGENSEQYRANDDGEPTNSAGMPILGQLQAFGLTNVLVVVRRHFGGTKLGIGGLIQAYRTTAKMALDHSKIIRKTVCLTFQIAFEYPEINLVMRVIKEKNLLVVEQILELNCNLIVSVGKNESETIRAIFENMKGVKIKEL